MSAIRYHVLHHRWLAVWLIALTLLMKIVVPNGYMLGSSNGTITIEICSGYGPVTMTMAMPGMAHHDDKPDHGKAEQPCAFAGLNAPAMSGADPLLLTIPVALAATCAFMLPVATPPNAIAYGSGYVTIGQMVKGGIWLNLIGIVLITLVTMTLAVQVFQITLG